MSKFDMRVPTPYLYITYWDTHPLTEGLRQIIVPFGSYLNAPETDYQNKRIIRAMETYVTEDVNDYFAREWMIIDDIVDSVVPRYDDDEDWDWTGFGGHVLEVIVFGSGGCKIWFSILNPENLSDVLKAEEFLFIHKIPRSKLITAQMLRHDIHNTTIGDILF